MKDEIIRTLKISGIFIAILWGIKLFETITGINLVVFGIYPREKFGLVGILTSVFIHSDFTHLISNSSTLFVLIAALKFFYKDVFFKTTIFICLFSGILVWLFARNAYHIGASGLIYGLVAFFFFSGLFRRDIRSMTLSVLMVFFYSGMIYGLFPVKEQISWEGHLFGAVAGLVASFFFKNDKIYKKYDWEDEELDPNEKPEISYTKGYPFE